MNCVKLKIDMKMCMSAQLSTVQKTKRAFTSDISDQFETHALLSFNLAVHISLKLQVGVKLPCEHNLSSMGKLNMQNES